MSTVPIRVASATELDALIGQHVTYEEPEIYWEDSHGQFQFATEEEARRALHDPYYQRFLPEVDWTKTIVREVRAYRPYCAEAALIWIVVEKASLHCGSLGVWKDQGRWHAAFGPHPPGVARTANVAICLAALRACGIHPEVNHDRVDAQITQYAVQMQQRLDAQPA